MAKVKEEKDTKKETEKNTKITKAKKKKETKKPIKKTDKSKKNEKPGKEKKKPFFKSVISEMKKVIFPSFKDVMKYTGATLGFCLFLVAFFSILNLVLSLIKGMF